LGKNGYYQRINFSGEPKRLPKEVFMTQYEDFGEVSLLSFWNNFILALRIFALF